MPLRGELAATKIEGYGSLQANTEKLKAKAVLSM